MKILDFMGNIDKHVNKLFIVWVLLVIIFMYSAASTISGICNEVNKHGLKSIIEEVWEDENKEESKNKKSIKDI